MKIGVRIKTRQKQETVERLADNLFLVRVKDIPQKGRANQALIGLLAEYFKVNKEHVRICKGQKSKNKIVEIRT